MAYGYNLTQIRQKAAQIAGKFFVGTADTTSTTTTLIDLNWPVNSTTAGPGKYKDFWIYTPSSAAADRMRMVKTYTGSGGQLAVDTAYGTKPSASDPYELHGLWPPIGNENNSWLTLINDGLKMIYLPIEISLNPTSTTDTRISLAAYSGWLTDEFQVRKGGVLSSGQSRSVNDPYLVYPLLNANCETDSPTVYLNHYPRTFALTDTIYLQCLQPVYYAIQAAGVGPYSQVGMALETDVAPIDSAEVGAYAALVQAWQRDSVLMDTSVQGRLVNTLQQAVAQFNAAAPDYDMRCPLLLKRRRQWGPRRMLAGSGVYSMWPHG